MTTTKGSTEIKALKDAQQAAQRLTAYEQELRERHAALIKSRQLAVDLFPPRAEVLESCDRMVDQAAAAWARDHAVEVTMAIAGQWSEGTGYAGTRPSLPSTRLEYVSIAELAGLVPEAVRAQLRSAIYAVPDEHFGLTRTERLAALAEMDAELADIERQHTELVDHAGAVGIVLAFLPHVGERRKKEQLSREREDLLAVERGGSR